MQLEHIWNRKGSREKFDHWSNFATVCQHAHDWKHANSVQARIAIMWYKQDMALRQPDLPPEFWDVDALNEAAGMDVMGWVEVKLYVSSRMVCPPLELPDWCDRMARELLQRHKDGQRNADDPDTEEVP